MYRYNVHVVDEFGQVIIAATARSAGLVLATLNPHHFRGIEGLAVEDWTR